MYILRRSQPPSTKFTSALHLNQIQTDVAENRAEFVRKAEGQKAGTKSVRGVVETPRG